MNDTELSEHRNLIRELVALQKSDAELREKINTLRRQLNAIRRRQHEVTCAFRPTA